PVVGEQGQPHLLVKELGPKAVADARRPGDVGVAQGACVVAVGDQLARQHPPVDEVHRLALRVQASAAVLEQPRVADDRPDTSLLEERLEHLELGRRGQALPVDDRYRRAGTLAPLREGSQHGAKLPAPSGEEAAAKLLAEGLHHRQPGEDRGLVVATSRQDLGPDGHAKRSLAECQLALPLTRRQNLGAGSGEMLVLEQRVVGGDGVSHTRVGLGDGERWTYFHQRCSPRQGGCASPRAYASTRSHILSSTQPKLSSLIEKLSKSGAGLRKSIAYRTSPLTANSTVSMS